MLLKLSILSLLLLTGCAPSYTVYWGAWSEWSEWKPTGHTETRLLAITSDPPKCEAFINGKFEGTTPLGAALSYPVLLSQRERKKYQKTHSNPTLEWIVLSKGDKPGTTKAVDSEKEQQTTLKSLPYNLVVKKEGYRTAFKAVSLEDSSAHFVLKPKPCLFPHIKVDNKYELSTAQKLHDTIFGKKYAKDISPEEIRTILEAENNLKEVFTFSAKKAGCHQLSYELTIRNAETNLNITILDSKGEIVSQTSSTFKTAFERKEFLSDLSREITKEAYKMHNTLCKE